LKCFLSNREKEFREMKTNKLFRQCVTIAIVFLSVSALSMAQQTIPKLQMAELTKKLQLTEQQQKQIAPLVAERDKKVEALETDKSMGKLQKLKQAMQLQTDFRNGAAKYLTADQLKKLDQLQAERRAKFAKAKG
jgi:sensor histidine kinase regulating citrate/malate metabolism